MKVVPSDIFKIGGERVNDLHMPSMYVVYAVDRVTNNWGSGETSTAYLVQTQAVCIFLLPSRFAEKR